MRLATSALATAAAVARIARENLIVEIFFIIMREMTLQKSASASIDGLRRISGLKNYRCACRLESNSDSTGEPMTNAALRVEMGGSSECSRWHATGWTVDDNMTVGRKVF